MSGFRAAQQGSAVRFRRAPATSHTQHICWRPAVSWFGSCSGQALALRHHRSKNATHLTHGASRPAGWPWSGARAARPARARCGCPQWPMHCRLRSCHRPAACWRRLRQPVGQTRRGLSWVAGIRTMLRIMCKTCTGCLLSVQMCRLRRLLHPPFANTHPAPPSSSPAR